MTLEKIIAELQAIIKALKRVSKDEDEITASILQDISNDISALINKIKENEK